MAVKAPPAPVVVDLVRIAYLEHLAGMVNGITNRYKIRAAARAAGETVSQAGDPLTIPTWGQWQADHAPVEES